MTSRDVPVVRGVLLDLDGTVYEDDRLVPGADQAIAALRAAGLPVLFGTNTTRMSRPALASRLGAMGLTLEIEQLHTAPMAARRWLEQRYRTRVALYVPEAAASDFAGFEQDRDNPEAVVVGDLGSSWTFELLNQAFRQVLGGATLVALQRNRYWKHEGRLTLDAGPMVAAIEYGAGVSAVVAGKPSRAFMATAAASLGIDSGAMVVVGDDIGADIAGAATCGAIGVLVRTGKFRATDLDEPPIRPSLVIDSIADLPAALGL